MDIFEEIAKVKREGKRAALATIVNARGSIPSVVAAKMLVREDGSILGTVGGGCVEGDVRKGAMEVMRDEKPKMFEFNLNQRPDDDTGLVSAARCRSSSNQSSHYLDFIFSEAATSGTTCKKWRRWRALKLS